MKNIQNIISYIELIGDRPSIEESFRTSLSTLGRSNEKDALEKIIHLALWQQLRKLLIAEEVITISGNSISVNVDNVEDFFFQVDLVKSGRDYPWSEKIHRPLLYASPPQIIPKSLASDVDDIRNLLAETVGSAHKSLLLLSPYTTPTAISGIFQPLFKSYTSELSIRIFIPDRLRKAYNLIDSLETMMPKEFFDNIIFYYRTDTSKEDDNIIHAKILIADSNRGYLGSANFTDQGINKHFELGVEVRDRQAGLVVDMLEQLVLKKIFQPLIKRQV